MNALEESLRMINTLDGDIPFLKDLWSFFSSKGVKTSFLTVNPEQSFLVDLEVCEGLGCPIQIFTNKNAVQERWEAIAKTLKARKIAEEDLDKEWLKGIEKKWILPKNLVVNSTEFKWESLKDILKSNSSGRIDLLKIEGTDGLERMLLYSMIECGARPGLILVRYTEDPDTNVPAMLVAGHLQNSGYRLISTNNNWFFYMFNDLCLYDSCSWRDAKVNNPLVQYIGDQFAQANSVVSSVSTSVEEKQTNE